MTIFQSGQLNNDSSRDQTGDPKQISNLTITMPPSNLALFYGQMANEGPDLKSEHKKLHFTNFTSADGEVLISL